MREAPKGRHTLCSRYESTTAVEHDLPSSSPVRSSVRAHVKLTASAVTVTDAHCVSEWVRLAIVVLVSLVVTQETFRISDRSVHDIHTA